MTRRLTDVLIDEGMIDAGRLGELLAKREDANEQIEDYLIRVGAITESDRAKALSAVYNVPFVDFQSTHPSADAIAAVPRDVAVRGKAMPVAVQGNQIVVAMSDPADIMALDDLRSATGREVIVTVASRTQIHDALMRYYGLDEDVRTVVERIQSDSEEDASVVRLVEALLNRAIADRSSDIHIEPMADRSRVRVRVDGALRESSEVPKELHDGVVARIKILAEMDIAEKRSPQDGRIAYSVAGKAYDLRVSTYPSIFGEKVVMRILDKTSLVFELEKLGLHPMALQRVQTVVERPYGMMLVCGPTGSGKTTTLYGCLSHLNSAERNIITIEDPVEYQLSGITQGSVNVKAGMTFANGLRSILRQDPDVVLVGEIRDQETAEVAIEAALTGHMVFSTLHANEASGAPGRLLEMGIEPFLLASALVGVCSQRLIRLLCPDCKTDAAPDPALAARLGVSFDGVRTFGAVGCHRCNFSGYRGRTVILECLLMDDAVRKAVMRRESTSVIRQCATEGGMVPLYQDAARHVIEGRTSIEELFRVVANDLEEMEAEESAPPIRLAA
ncbi:MAG: type II/IV secretion system protein [Armatimonadetes bacterium]|nr:type II/IV secretion system protein [Armatimonadota bacterium]